jgi:putative DNA primase/helicase
MSSDPYGYALRQLLDAGLLVEHLELGPPPNGKVWRVDVEGSKRGKKAGWYIAHEMKLDDGRQVVVGSYGVWTGSDNQAQKLRFDGAKSLNDAERRRWKQQQEQINKQQEEARADLAREAAKRAKELWAKLPDQGSSPYLDRKKVRAYGVRFGRDGSIAIPLVNGAGLLLGMQFVLADGSKKFLTGTAKRGAWHLIGTVSEEMPLVFAEGYATAASIHMATGWPAVVCFDCGNLLPVAQAVRHLFPSVHLLFAGDDDHQRVNNPGRSHAVAAAKWMRSKTAFPRFADPQDRTDFNDLHIEQGLDVVREQLQQSFTPIAQMGEVDPKEQPWARELVFGDGGLKAMVHNAILVLNNHPAWKGVFGYDQFAKRVVKRKRTPYGSEPGPMRDADEIEIAAWFGRRDAYGISMPTIQAREATVVVADRNQFHPVREYLHSLKWDGTERIPAFFPDHFNVAAGPVPTAFALNFFISAVARVMRPGCKADCMLVLEGEQGARKSSFVSALCGEAWFADVGTTPSDKDFFQIIQGRWLVELSELASFNKADNAHIKRALSVQTDTFRPSYGRNAESFPRECIFVGTVNNSDWQRDETGGRRYMPMWVGEINLDAIRDQRDQLWAEALARFKRGEKWWEMPPEARDVQEDRYIEDVWAEPVHRWLDGLCSSDRYGSGMAAKIQKTTVAEILSRALDVDAKKQDRAMQTRVGNLLRRMGWRRIEKRVGGIKIRQYCRPTTQANEEKP